MQAKVKTVSPFRKASTRARRKLASPPALGKMRQEPRGFSFLSQQTFTSHRCGWNYALQALQPLHKSEGILFDGFLESTFCWGRDLPACRQVPYRRPWAGFLHNPHNMPKWFLYHDSPQSIFSKSAWQESMESCVGLFCLSEYQAEWVRSHTHKPVSTLIHPTEIPRRQFDFNKFISNPHKKIVQLGWWLRQLNAIYQLPIARHHPIGYEKIRLNPASKPASIKLINSLLEKEREIERISLLPQYLENTRELSRLSDREYDTLLTENIAFAFLHDSSANNTVIECIARATPIVVNPLPAVVEYLGEGYPLYASTLQEAAEKVMELDLIRAAHEYLKTCDRRYQLSASYFRQAFQASEVYQLTRSVFS